MDLKNENKNTRKGVIKLVNVVIALHVAYHLPLTLLQAKKGSEHDLKS
jgi:sulfopyruvate decarboxylase TPP-binding subunit